MKELMDINIPNEFRNFVESLDNELRDLFNYYCLGIRKNSEFVKGYTLDYYIELVREALQKKSNLGFRYVVYKCITSDHTLQRIFGRKRIYYHQRRCVIVQIYYLHIIMYMVLKICGLAMLQREMKNINSKQTLCHWMQILL